MLAIQSNCDHVLQKGSLMEGKKIVIVVAVLLVLIGGGVLLATQMNNDTTKETEQTSQQDTTPVEEQKTVVGLAVATPDLSTLVTAVTAAELVDTLSSAGPFTVFAPTNAAFANLPAGTLDSLLLAENIEQLKSVLTYHVVAASALSSDLTNGQVLTTVQGGTLTVSIADGKVTLTDAKGGVATVVQADIKASNGVVHVIDAVLLQ